MACGEDETVAVEPTRRVRIVTQGFSEQHRADLGTAQRQAQVAGVAGMDGIHGEATGFIGGLSKQCRIHEN